LVAERSQCRRNLDTPAPYVFTPCRFASCWASGDDARHMRAPACGSDVSFHHVRTDWVASRRTTGTEYRKVRKNDTLAFKLGGPHVCARKCPYYFPLFWSVYRIGDMLLPSITASSRLFLRPSVLETPNDIRLAGPRRSLTLLPVNSGDNIVRRRGRPHLRT
jgi:hypothetical protein